MIKEYIEREVLSCVSCTHYEACKVWVNHCNELLCGFGVRRMDFPFVCAVPKRLCERYQPTADVVEVRHGHWENAKGVVGVNPATLDFEIGDTDRCSLCGVDFEAVRPKYKYCPFCGAKMDGEGERHD